MGFLDKAKKLAEQAKGVAEQAKGLAEDALAEAKARTATSDEPARSSSSSTAADPRSGTAYVPGMLGRPGWREEGLADPAAVLPAADRDRAGIPPSTRSEIVEEPFGMGRRWSAGGRSAGLFYQLYPEHQAWQPPAGWTPLVGVPASAASLPDGRALIVLEGAVLETAGLDEPERMALARAVARQLASA